MNTSAVPAAEIPADVLADSKALIEAAMAGRRPDADIAKRCRERAARITEDVQRKHGVLDIVVPAIRELRDS